MTATAYDAADDQVTKNCDAQKACPSKILKVAIHVSRYKNSISDSNWPKPFFDKRGGAMPEYDYLIVGTGWFGAVFAHQMTQAGYKCLAVDKREHIAGNSYTQSDGGIQVHRYGPHIFHTNSSAIWNYVNRFANFLPFVYRGRASSQGKLYSFPINLMTFKQVWGIDTPQAARQKLSEVRATIINPQNLEEWILSQIGEELYRLFIYGYTTKQWRRHPRDLPASIIKRLPIRTEMDDNYYNDKFQGIPENGYTAIFEKLLNGVVVRLGVDFFAHRNRLEHLACKVVYTGMIDQLFDYHLGELDYRTLRFDTQRLETSDFQGTPVINYTDLTVPYTRIIEHKHFGKERSGHTVVTHEYPEDWRREAEPYYPVNDSCNQRIFEAYRRIARSIPNLILGGRLASYRYYDMHQVIGAALVASHHELTALGCKHPIEAI